MRVAVVPGPGRSGLLCGLREDGSPDGEPLAVPDLTAAIAARENGTAREADPAGPRWVWASAASVYPRLLEAGVRVARCHDVLLADALLTGRDSALGLVPAAGDADPVQAAFGLLRAAEKPRPEPGKA
ncbi:MAG: hypothetical protein ACR2FU_05485, partial [Streptosporangiaceae bacterium]